MVPTCVSTVTRSPTFFPSKALPTGDSLEILPFKLFASVDPTILYISSSSNSRSKIFTWHPILIEPTSTSSSSTISAFFNIFSISSIRASISRCSSFAASYSAFSDKSPCSRASLIFCATSLRYTTINSSNSSSNFFRPALVKMFFLFIILPFSV